MPERNERLLYRAKTKQFMVMTKPEFVKDPDDRLYDSLALLVRDLLLKQIGPEHSFELEWKIKEKEDTHIKAITPGFSANGIRTPELKYYLYDLQKGPKVKNDFEKSVENYKKLQGKPFVEQLVATGVTNEPIADIGYIIAT